MSIFTPTFSPNELFVIRSSFYEHPEASAVLTYPLMKPTVYVIFVILCVKPANLKISMGKYLLAKDVLD